MLCCQTSLKLFSANIRMPAAVKAPVVRMFPLRLKSTATFRKTPDVANIKAWPLYVVSIRAV